MHRLAAKARHQHDYTGAAALSTASSDLSDSLMQVEASLTSFSFLASDAGAIPTSSIKSSAGIGAVSAAVTTELEISERIAREGSASFIDSDFLFEFSCHWDEGHSIGSLAIIAGAGSILRHIRANWPNLHSLMYNPYSTTNNAPFTSTMEDGFENDQSKLHEQTGTIDFRDANRLRLMGFDARALRQAGFSDIEILTAGFTAMQLRAAGFSTEELRSAGLTDQTLRAVGYNLEQQV